MYWRFLNVCIKNWFKNWFRVWLESPFSRIKLFQRNMFFVIVKKRKQCFHYNAAYNNPNKYIWMSDEGVCTKTGPLNHISYHLTRWSKWLFLQDLWQVYQNRSECHLTVFCIDGCTVVSSYILRRPQNFAKSPP